MPTFRPSARVRLHLRVDEGDATAGLRSRLPRNEEDPAREAAPAVRPDATRRELEEELAQVQDMLAQLVGRREDIAPRLFETYAADFRAQRDELQRRLEGEDLPQSRPDALAGPPSDDRVILGQILPISVQIERNGLRTADTATITIDYRDAPIDPRIVRAASVEVTVGTVSPGLYEAGMRGERDADGMLLSVVDRGIGAGVLNPATRFIGWVDEWTIDASGDDGDTITLSCRDMTALLIDEPLGALTIDLRRPIRDGIQELLDSLPSTRGLRVRLGQTEEEDGPGPVPATAVPAVRRARRGRSVRRARAGSARMNVWDHITDTTVGLGLVPLMDGYELRLVQPRTYFARDQTPRRMVYGENLSSLHWARKLGGVKSPTIEVRCYDAQIGRTRWARYPGRQGDQLSGIFGQNNPPRAIRANEPGIAGSAPDEKIQTYTVSNVTDPELLQTVARSIYEQIGRQELEGYVETDEITSLDGSEGDLLSLNAGDALELLVRAARGPGEARASDEGTTSLQELQAMTRQDRAAYLVSLGWSQELADRLAALQDATAFDTVFRVQNVRLTWSVDEGVAVKADFVNFVTVRDERPTEQQTLGEAEDPSAEVANRTRDRRSEAAEILRTASAHRRWLTREREEGRLQPDEYAEQMREATQRELEARRNLEAS